MELKSKIYHRSCSAVQSRTAGNKSKHSAAGSFTNLSCTGQSTKGTNYLQDVLSKIIFDQKSTSFCNKTQNRNIYMKQTQRIFPKNERSSFFPNSETLDDVSSSLIRELKYELQELNLELIKEKNNGQLLKRDILVAKKVVEKEITANTEKFEILLAKADNKSWKGRQQIILALKRRLRQLNEIVDSLNDGAENVWRRKKSTPKTEELTAIITDDRKVRMCLELERREVKRNAERYRQDIVVSRDIMKSNLERLTNKNESLMKDSQILRKKLSAVPKRVHEEPIKQLHDIKNKLKKNLEEKIHERRNIDTLEEEICQNSKIIEELTTALDAERQALKEKREKVKTLKEGKTKLEALSEDTKKGKLKQTAIRKKKLEDVHHTYDKIIAKSENLRKQLTDSKHLSEKRRTLLLKNDTISFNRKSVSSRPTEILKEHQIYQHKEINYSELPRKIPNYWACSYKRKLLKYQSIFQLLDGKNEDKMRNFSALTDETKKGILELLENRYLVWKLTSDIKTMKSQNKKLKNSVLCSTKQKLLKKKNSSQQMIEFLNERKTFLAIRKKENNCLKSLIIHVLYSKVDDCNIFQNYLTRNKNVFLKELTHIKL